MKVLILLFALLSSPLGWAQVEGRGRFQATDEDSVTFVRNQLIARAVRDALDKELKAMGLEADGFWQRFDQRFEAAFNAVHEELKKKYKIGEEEVNARQRQAYETELRQRRLNMEANFGNLARALDSYSIKNQSRSTQGGATRYMTIEARVNRRTLNGLYSDFMREGKARYFYGLLMTLDLDLKDADWSDVGVSLSRDLTSVLETHWASSLRSRLPRQVGEIYPVGPNLRQQLDDFLKMPREASVGLSTLSEGAEIDLDNLDEATAGTSLEQKLETQPRQGEFSTDRFADSLWLKIDVRLTKTDEDLAAGVRTFRYEGDFILIDLRDQSILHGYKFEPEEHSYPIEENQALSSSVATQIARMATGEFERLGKVLSETRSDKGHVVLTLNKLKSLQDYYQFSEKLSQAGLTLDFIPQLEHYDGRTARIGLDYKGEAEQMLRVLRSLHQQSLKEGGPTILAREQERPYDFELMAMPLVEEGAL